MDNQFDPAYSFMSLHTDGSSASGSFSAASTTGSLPDPFTPSSGRSTPVFLNMPMDHDNAACGILEIGPTPPASDFGPFLTQNMKPEASHYMGPGPNPYNHEMATPPMDYQPAPYAPEIFNFNTLPSNTTPPWSWPPEDGPVMFFGGDQPRMFGEAYPTLSYQAVLERATALHRVQGQPRISRRNRQTQVVMPNDIKTIVHPSGLFKCHHQKCGSKKPFKRAEHLKRHLNTVHSNGESKTCRFCRKCFNRSDNYGQHIKLHASLTGGRTKYYKDAEALDEKLEGMKKQRRRPQKKKVFAEHTTLLETRGVLV